MNEPDVSDLLSVQQAIAILDATQVFPRPVRLPLAQTVGLYLAEDLRCDRDSPPFDKSLMDGWAVRAVDLSNAPRELSIAGQIAAGQSGAALEPGKTVAIMTGAPLPAGADAVVPIELASADSNRVLFHEPVIPGRFIARRGNESRAGDVALKAGAKMGPAQIAVGASIGAASPSVFASPSVAVLSTGDELVPYDQTPSGPQIRSSNTPMLLALLARYNCLAADLGITPDDPQKTRQSIVAGLKHDVLLISGGMSMGAHDYVPAILHQLGADMKITKLRIKPGKPFVFAQMPGGKFVFGLPGNPVSAFVCTVRFVSRLLTKIAGGLPRDQMFSGILATPLEANGPREFYQPAHLDGQRLTPLSWKGSADIFTLARANALLVRPENQGLQPSGTAVHFLEI